MRVVTLALFKPEISGLPWLQSFKDPKLPKSQEPLLYKIGVGVQLYSCIVDSLNAGQHFWGCGLGGG